MLILFDNGTPRVLHAILSIAMESRKLRSRLGAAGNGDLLAAAENAGFEVLVTTDKNLRYQQNLVNRKIAIVVLGKGRWSVIKRHVSEVIAAVNEATPGSFAEVEIPIGDLIR